jgi:hypothetical protein
VIRFAKCGPGRSFVIREIAIEEFQEQMTPTRPTSSRVVMSVPALTERQSESLSSEEVEVLNKPG